PLFSRFQIEHQIETAYSRMVPLPSGGAIVIDHTEALVSIDVNSARATRGSDIEDTAFRTNLEAAEEVARQLRLRDLGGLIVIDFIDMEKAQNQKDVENKVKESLHLDRARVQMGKISRFGLMELSRQRIRPALNEGSHTTCPRCNGTGVIRDTESSALHVLRIIQEEAMKEGTASVRTQVPVDVATFLLNEKRSEIHKLEARLKVSILLIPNKHLETPHYEVTRLRHDDEKLDEDKSSFDMVNVTTEQSYYERKIVGEAAKKQEAVIKGVIPAQPAPPAAQRPAKKAEASGPSLWERIVNWLSGGESKKKAPALEDKSGSKSKGDRPARNTRGRNNRRRGSGRRDEGAVEETASQSNDTKGGRRNSRSAKGRSDEQADKQVSDNKNQPAQSDSSQETSSGNEKSDQTRGRRRRRGRRGGAGQEANVNESTQNQKSVDAGTADESVQADNQKPSSTTDNQNDQDDGREPRRRRRRRRGVANREEQQTHADSAASADGESTGHTDEKAPASNSANPEAEAEVQGLAPSQADTPAKSESAASSNLSPTHAEQTTPSQAMPSMTEAAQSNASGEQPVAASQADVPVKQEGDALESAQPTEASPVNQSPVSEETVHAETHEPREAGEVKTASADEPAPEAIEASVEPVVQRQAQSTAQKLAAAVDKPYLNSMLKEAGMLWIETDHEKWTVVQDKLAQQPKPVRKPRVRKPAPLIETGNLVLIETRPEFKHDRQ
ncbi:MAG: ribonuclease E/G, partial [Limnobacter sp.]|nr:ribonuclease E/G [Limnobacter sp.]